MIEFFRQLFNEDKSVQNALIGVNDVDVINANIDAYREKIEKLEAEVKEYKGYKLKYQVAILQSNEAEYLELLEIAEANEKYKEEMRSYHNQRELQGRGLLQSAGDIYGYRSHQASMAVQQQINLQQSAYNAFYGRGKL